MNNSIWTNDVQMPRFPHLEHDLKTDILIIGGGLAGILCAHRLAQDGVDYALLEADRICHGVTRNTTAKITSQHGLIYGKLIREFGTEAARKYWEINEEAIREYRELANTVDCDFEVKDNYIYAVDSTKELEEEMAALERLGIPAQFAQKLPLPLTTAGAVCFRVQAQFNPIKLVSGIAKGLNIYEKTAAKAFVGNTVLTDRAKITASKIIVATHFPILNKHGSYFLKMYQQRSYVLALEHTPQLDGMYLDGAENGLSFRNYGDLLRGTPYRKEGRWMGRAGVVRSTEYSRFQGSLPLGNPGLHDPGWSALYRAVQQRDAKSLCGHRIQQVGNDYLHGGLDDSQRSGAGEGESLYRPLFTIPDHAQTAAVHQWIRSSGESADAHQAPVSPHGLRPEMESSGA